MNNYDVGTPIMTLLLLRDVANADVYDVHW